jgi:hypothetical protein
MQLQDLLAQMGGLQQMARELGVNEQQVKSGAAALLPAITGGFKKQAQSGGIDGLTGMLGKLGGGGLLDNVLSSKPTDVSRGNDVLGQIFGSKDVSRTVAANAATSSGLDAATLQKLLPMLAMAVGGFMAKQANAPSAPAAGGGLGGLVAGLASGGNKAAPGGGGLASMLDMDGNGNPLDDIMRLAGKALR